LELIRAAKPDAKNVLELGCGTGSILKHLQDAYEVSGLDISGKMVSVARKKVPRAKLFQQDMVDFRIDGRFDVIVCGFDSINHVRRFSDWKKVFAAVCRHLSPGGCFIFDINTLRKLEPPHRRTTLGTSVRKEPVDHRCDRASEWRIKLECQSVRTPEW
jgi:predicted TPR repeat methyltransferase